MKAKKCWILAIVSFSILIILWPAQQITGETDLSAKDKETDSNLTALQKLALSAKPVRPDKKGLLQGLEGVCVLVEPIKPEVDKYGLTTKALQNDTKFQLRQHGIKVLTREESYSTPEGPYLYITVNVFIREDLPTAAAAITVQLRENVLLLREPPRICISARTWQSSGVVSVGKLRLNDLRGPVKYHVNEFINDYLAANPKETKAKSKW